MRRRHTLEIAGLAAALVLFLALALYQIDLPGLYYDEAADAVPAMQMLHGQPLELFRGVGLWIGDRAFPLMVMDYVGTVNSYLLVPFFALFGVGAVSMRLMTVLASASGLVLTFLLCRSLFGWVAAVLAALLLAVQPSFIFWSRQGIYVTSIMLPLAMGGLVCLRRWHRSSSGGYLILGLFLLGLGVSAKLLFLWVVVASAVLYLALSRKRISLLPGAGGIAALAIGAAMPLVFNLEGQGTLSLLSRNLVQTEQGVNNLAILPNLATRAGDLMVLMDGGFFWFLGGVFHNSIFPWLVLGAAAGLVIMAALPGGVLSRGGRARHGRRPYSATTQLHESVQSAKCADNHGSWVAHRKGIAFLLGFIILIFIQSGVTISGLWPTHFFILLPFVAMALAVFARLLPESLPWPRTAWAAGLALWAVAFFPSLWVDLQYHRALAETGGWMAHSDAIYRLADALDRGGDPQPLAMDWGIRSSVQVLTQGRVNPQEVFEYQPQPDQTFFDLTYKAMQDPRRLYIFRAGELTVYPRMEAFESLVKRLGMSSYLEDTITQRDGRPLYLIYSVR